MKNFWQAHKLSIFLFFVILFSVTAIASSVVVGDDRQEYYRTRIIEDRTIKINDVSPIGIDNRCVINNTDEDYFIPTKTAAEFNAYLANTPAGLTNTFMCGPTGSEFCITGDCNDDSGKTHANCPNDCECDVYSECGEPSEPYDWSCNGNQNLEYIDVVNCSNHYCDTSETQISNLYKTCGGELNALCVDGKKGCVNKCNHPDYLGDKDLTNTACGGCGGICTYGAPYCDPVTTCFTNGNYCINYVAKTVSGRCMCDSSAKYFDGASSSCKNTYASCGYGQYAVNSSSCAKCPEGSYGDYQGHCASCPNGTYSDSEGATSCTQCPAGSWCTGGIKFLCPAGTTSPMNSTSTAACMGDGSGD